MSSLDWKEIEIVLRGKRVKGRYNVSEGLVTVAAWSGTNTAPLGRCDACSTSAFGCDGHHSPCSLEMSVLR